MKISMKHNKYLTFLFLEVNDSFQLHLLPKYCLQTLQIPVSLNFWIISQYLVNGPQALSENPDETSLSLIKVYFFLPQTVHLHKSINLFRLAFLILEILLAVYFL